MKSAIVFAAVVCLAIATAPPASARPFVDVEVFPAIVTPGDPFTVHVLAPANSTAQLIIDAVQVDERLTFSENDTDVYFTSIAPRVFGSIVVFVAISVPVPGTNRTDIWQQTASLYVDLSDTDRHGNDLTEGDNNRAENREFLDALWGGVVPFGALLGFGVVFLAVVLVVLRRGPRVGSPTRVPLRKAIFRMPWHPTSNDIGSRLVTRETLDDKRRRLQLEVNWLTMPRFGRLSKRHVVKLRATFIALSHVWRRQLGMTPIEWHDLLDPAIANAKLADLRLQPTATDLDPLPVPVVVQVPTVTPTTGPLPSHDRGNVTEDAGPFMPGAE